ncbi:18S rRNA maturation protein, partial [Irineochytrium annulatum]
MDSSANANGGPRRKDRQVIRKGPPVEGQAAKKKRLRDSERMLKRENLPADIRIDLQRRVKALKLEIEERGKEEREHKLWERYKYVRHVEKTKLTRRIAALSRLSPSPTVSSQLQLLNLHLAYVTHFPRDVKYISLFPKSTSDGAAGDGAGKADEGAEGVTDRMRAEIMEKIRKAVETGDVKRHGWVLRMGEGWESGFKKE